MVRLFLDTEFIDRPWPDAPELISIGITDDRGQEFYAVNNQFDPEEDEVNPWVTENVVPHLSPRGGPEWMHPLDMKDRILSLWPKADEVWAYWGSWDWYLLVQRIFGGFDKIPEGWPGFFHELGALKRSHKCGDCPPGEDEHHALADAKWNSAMHRHLKEIRK